MSKVNKPHYKLGTQNMLDLAGKDATRIPCNTLFLDSDGDYVARRSLGMFDDAIGVKMEWVDIGNGPTDFEYYCASQLSPIVK